MKERGYLGVTTLAVAVSLLVSLLATPYGLGVTPDSLLYLHGADSLRQGLGFRVPTYDGTLTPLTHYPPLYPATLAAVSLLGLDLMAAARVVSLTVTAANVLAVAAVTYAFTRSMATAATTSMLMAVSVDMLFLNTATWSDAQFILLTLGCLSLVTAYLQGRGFPWLVAGALVGALAWLGRWVGGSVVVTGGLAALFLGPGPLRRRFADAVLFGLLACGLPVAWMVHNALVAGSATNRSAALSMARLDHGTALVQTMSAWLLPGTNRVQVMAGQDVLAGCTALLAVGALAHATIRWVWPTIDGRPALARTPVVFLLFGVVYIASILAGASFLDAAVPMDNRILAPAYVAAIVVAAFVGHTAYRSASSRTVRAWSVALLASFLLGNTIVSLNVALYFRREGRGFVGPSWDFPTLRQTLAAVEPKALIYSNHPAAVEFALGRMAMDTAPDALVDAVEMGGQAILVYFSNARSYGPRHAKADKGAVSTDEYRAQLLSGLSVTELARERNGAVYRLRAKRPGQRN